MARWVALPVLLGAVIVAGSGCIGNEIVRRTVDLPDFRSWAGQISEAVADSLEPGVVIQASAIPEASGGSLEGIEELSIFVQLQNQDFTPSALSLYATGRPYGSASAIRANGVRILRPILLPAQTAIQIDARNYPNFAEGFEEFNDLIVNGDVYIYLLGTGSSYRVGANVPSVSMLLTLN